MSDASTDGPLFDPDVDSVAGTRALQALAHPLRLRLLGLLRVHGPSTATRLAVLVERSSGLTSYHLRHLAQAGLIVDADPDEIPDHPGGRDRWWKAADRATVPAPSPAGD